MAEPVHMDELEEDNNPFYCPSMPASLFLQNLRKQVRRGDPDAQENSLDNTPDLTDSSNEDIFPSFTKILDQSMGEEDLLELHYRPDFLRRTAANSDKDTSSLLSDPSVYRQQGPALLLDPRSRHTLEQHVSGSPVVSLTFSDFAVSPKRERSVIDVNEGSFELSAKADKLHFFTTHGLCSPEDVDFRYARTSTPKRVEQLTERVRVLEDELHGMPIGTESPRGISNLISRLAAVLPGIRLAEKLIEAGARSHQQIVDVLAANGFLNTRVLNILRTSEIEYLDLAASIGDEGGLNLDSRDLFQVFLKRNCFPFLAEINLTGAEVHETDLLHLHGLPRLARLWLASTGIGNEAIFYLTPLKRSLTDLDIAYNSKIDDDAIPALLVLKRLQCLSFHGTCITMVGLRRLAKTLKEQRRDMEVEVPRRCEEYIRKTEKEYLVDLAPPLIADPDAVSSLTTAAIQRNLAAHAHGLKSGDEDKYAAQRLRALLETREADLLARALVLQEPLE
ncbi:hypothetical protein BDW22DRAFT_1417564 [Trametopsis cervina]|nr:hypothetical protein BDW22DRAFT_1417564 [Trametopsis cervina]